MRKMIALLSHMKMQMSSGEVAQSVSVKVNRLVEREMSEGIPVRQDVGLVSSWGLISSHFDFYNFFGTLYTGNTV